MIEIDRNLSTVLPKPYMRARARKRVCVCMCVCHICTSFIHSHTNCSFNCLFHIHMQLISLNSNTSLVGLVINIITASASQDDNHAQLLISVIRGLTFRDRLTALVSTRPMSLVKASRLKTWLSHYLSFKFNKSNCHLVCYFILTQIAYDVHIHKILGTTY